MTEILKIRRKSCLHRERSYYVTFLFLSERVFPASEEVTKFAIVKIPFLSRQQFRRRSATIPDVIKRLLVS